MVSHFSRAPEGWAQLCRDRAYDAGDPVTKLFLDQLAREFDIAANEAPELTQKREITAR
jgi:hypothetical protein